MAGHKKAGEELACFFHDTAVLFGSFLHRTTTGLNILARTGHGVTAGEHGGADQQNEACRK